MNRRESIGRPMRGRLVSADEEGLLVRMMGAETPLRWSDLGAKRLHALASKYADGRAERSELLRLFAGAYGLGED